MLKMSVIVPVYNSEQYLPDCLDSLVGQTLDSSLFEVLLIDDGSTDGSGAIIDEYAEKHSIFKCFHVENRGQSEARNYALKRAQGKYISFLDSDDMFSSEMLEKYADFFDKHGNETDLVTCRITRVNSDGTFQRPHRRYGTLFRTAVYDLNEGENPYIAHSSMNICIKNKFENNIQFDRCPWQEDMKLCISLVKEKQTIGFVDGCDYFYLQHVGSTAATYLQSYYIYEEITAFWERLFAEYDSHVPEFIQGYFLNDFAWKTKANILMPYHYSDEEYAKALGRIYALINRTDDDVIKNAPYLDGGRKNMLLHINHDSDADYDFNEKPRTIIRRMKLKDDTIRIEGRVNTSLADKEGFEAYLCAGKTRVKLDLRISTATPQYGFRMAYNHYEFVAELPLSDRQKITVEYSYKGENGRFLLSYAETSPLNSQRDRAAIGEYLIRKMLNKAIIVKKTGKFARSLICAPVILCFALKHPRAYLLRRLSKAECPGRIWLYSDRDGFTDNAYLQFKHDVAIDDGIQRYYIRNALKEKDVNEKFTPDEKKHLVDFKSQRHFLLFFHAEKLFTSFAEEDVYTPYGKGPQKFYTDLPRPELVYLQHGVIHADLSHLYSREICGMDKFVASSQFEYDRLTTKYNYAPSQMILSGMPSLDMISEGEAKNKILFSPSWRKNLIGKYKDGQRVLKEDVFLNSVFYKETEKFLNSDRLVKMLADSPYTLEFKNHPIFEPYNNLISSKSDKVKIISGSANLSDYNLMITDFSSIVFNFVYLGRPIVYFAPDYDLFRSGMTHSYRKLDLPLEEAFGPLTMTADELLDELEKLIASSMKPNDVYVSRGAEFFSCKSDHRQKLYEALINE